MSGFEVAGVVLGAIPLVIAALEHYAAGISTAKRFWFYKAQVEKLIDRIETQQTMYVNTLEELLVGIVKNEEIAELLANVESKMWTEPELDERLRDRLRGAYKVYFSNVKGMEVALEKVMVKLALDPDGKPQFTDPNMFKKEYRRLKFCLSETDYNKHLSDIQTHNQALERLTAQSLKLEPSRAETSSRSCPNYNVLREYARNVFDTLKSGLSCSCNNHAVKLRLESRNQQGDPEQVMQKTPLRVIFTLTSSSVPINVPVTQAEWREADIKVLSEKSQSAIAAIMVPVATSRSARRVRFDASGGPSASQQIACTAATSVTTMQSTMPILTPTAAQIQNLCRAIAATHIHSSLSDPCSGYLLDSCNRKHGIYLLSTPKPDPASSHNWAAYTLRQVLTRHVNVSRPLTQLDKFVVAVDLASSVLQLYKTPWLEESWDEDDVYFVHRPGTPISSIYQHPFIFRKLSSTAAPQSHITQKPARRVIRNQTLFTLGVLLIELLYAKPVEELRNTNDLDCQGTPGVVWCTAERLIEEEISFEAGPHYSDAVRRCIRCDFNHANHDLDDRDFQQIVYDGVVAPLEKTLRRFKGLD